MNGLRKIKANIPIGLHETVKKLANECNPPISHGQAIVLLLYEGISSFNRKAATKEPADVESDD